MIGKTLLFTIFIAIVILGSVYFLQRSSDQGLVCGNVAVKENTLLNDSEAKNAEGCFWNSINLKHTASISYLEDQGQFLSTAQFTYNNIFGMDLLFKRNSTSIISPGNTMLFNFILCKLPTKDFKGNIFITGCGKSITLPSADNCTFNEFGKCEF